MTADPVLAGLAAAAAAAVGGFAVPRVIAWLPEPEPQADPESAAGGDCEADAAVPPVAGQAASGDEPVAAVAPPLPPKVPYAELAARPRLGLWCAAVAAVSAAVLGTSRGWVGDLPVWVFLSVLGVALGYVDWRTRLLPSRLVQPSYGVVALLLLVAYAVEPDNGRLLGAAIGWVGLFAVFFALWFVYPRGLGYGDVRLSGLLGMALGWLGWQAVVVATYASFLLGGVIGGVLALLKVVDRRGYPFGPFMLVGVVLGVLAADGNLAFWS